MLTDDTKNESDVPFELNPELYNISHVLNRVRKHSKISALPFEMMQCPGSTVRCTLQINGQLFHSPLYPNKRLAKCSCALQYLLSCGVDVECYKKPLPNRHLRTPLEAFNEACQLTRSESKTHLQQSSEGWQCFITVVLPNGHKVEVSYGFAKSKTHVKHKAALAALRQLAAADDVWLNAYKQVRKQKVFVYQQPVDVKEGYQWEVKGMGKKDKGPMVYKHAFFHMKSVEKTMAGFANRDGGSILIGVRDGDYECQGIRLSPEDEDKLKLAIDDRASHLTNFSHKYKVIVHEVITPDNVEPLCVVEILVSKADEGKPVLTATNVKYMRQSASTRQVAPGEV